MTKNSFMLKFISFLLKKGKNRLELRINTGIYVQIG